MTCPITADRDEWRGAVTDADEAFCAAVWDALKADANDLRKQQRILLAHRAASKAREAGLRGALAAIIADTACCAASKAIARDALAKGGASCKVE